MDPQPPAQPDRMPLIERVIDASARNPFLVLILAFIAASASFWALRNTPLDAIPDLSDTQVIISTDWPGRSPDLVEDQLTYPISTRFIAAPRVKYVRGESMFGKSFVYVIFEDGTDIYWARSRVIEYLNSVRGSLPEGVNPVMGPDASGVGWVYEYALVDDTGKHDLSELRSFQDWHLRYALESVKGVAEVAAIGGFTKEYQVDLDPNKLVAYGIPLGDVVAKIRRSNNDTGGKTFEVGSTEYFVRGRGYIKSLADIEDIPLKVANGTPIYVKNVGTVHLGPDLRRGVAELDGKGEVTGGIVVMRHGENALAVIDGIKSKLKEIAPSLPPGVRIVPTYDRSKLIEASIATLREKLLEESLVVAAVCLIFLWHVRSSLVAIITLPVAVLLSFLPMYKLGLTSNIMSLGGIAIAIGAMVDAAIIMIENAHKQLEHFHEEQGREARGAERREVIISAARSVGRPLFFSLLVITVSFIPVFSLGGEEGRLFRPLAYTKTFAMGFAAVLGVTLVPVLMLLLVRGRIIPEARNPVNRLLIWAYRPFADFVLRFPWPTVVAAALVLAGAAIPYRRLGKEFMPPLNEGTILFMPTAVPGMSVGEAARILQVQDRLIRQIPEVETVFGKAGQADTATDPAPLSMFETVVTLRPHGQWRRGMTWDGIIAQMNGALKTPGMANIFWMPIQTRTEMLTTGFRSVLGIKVFGPDLATIQGLGVQIEKALGDLPDTRSVFAERTTGGYFLDFTVDRRAAARYGLTVGDVNDVVETAIGGKTIATTVEGRERYPIAVRYARDYRQDLDGLRRVLVPAPTGAQIPIGELADLSYRTGPPDIRNENGQLVGFVFVDVTTKNIDGYVRAAIARLAQRISFPPGYYVQWAGQFEYLKGAERKLETVIPFTLLIIFVLIYLNTRSAARTAIVLLSVPFSLVGAFWLLYLLHYNLSVAVWVGLIALAGLDAETGVVMLLYLDHSWDKFWAAGRLRTPADLHDAVIDGAVQRIRPKIMTVCAILFGLLPIMWSPVTQSGADVMKRIAAPMIGGIVTSAVLELLLYPAIYMLWRRRHLPEPRGADRSAPGMPWRRFVLVLAILAGVAWAYLARERPSPPGPTALQAPFATRTTGGLTVNLYARGGLHVAGNDVLVEFLDASSGRPVDVGTVRVVLDMNMPGMAMHSGGTVAPAGGPGRYRVEFAPEMAGDWIAKLDYDGPRGRGSMSFTATVAR
ncbi:MAG TPA: CusA/CzcA family heavy metal efflux RND transporter [Opitutaceae bacterium]|jgi:Cu(I)/Ag(I) efflux system membrane protein CusA/SilA